VCSITWLYESEPERPSAREIEGLAVARAQPRSRVGRTPGRRFGHFDAAGAIRRPEAAEDLEEAAVATADSTTAAVSSATSRR